MDAEALNYTAAPPLLSLRLGAAFPKQHSGGQVGVLGENQHIASSAAQTGAGTFQTHLPLVTSC